MSERGAGQRGSDAGEVGTQTRWLDAGVGAMMIALVILLLVNGATRGMEWLAWTAIGVISIGWVTIGRFARAGDARALTYTLVIVLGVAGLTAADPLFAVVQTLAYPVVWLLAADRRRALAANAAVAIAATIGLTVSIGTALPGAEQIPLIVLLSLGVSLAFGTWISRIEERSSERQRLLDELTAAQAALAALSHDAGSAAERERMAREIHDTIAQSLTGLTLLAQQATQELAAGEHGAVATRLAVIEEGARGALVEARSLVAAGAPVELGGGLEPALARVAARMEREAGIRVSVSVSLDRDLRRDEEVVLLRCAQEGLANVRKHSGAQHALLSLVSDAAGIHLCVADEGHGFDPASHGGGFGLDGLRDRLTLAGGSLEVRSGSAGTRLAATLPVAQAAEYRA